MTKRKITLSPELDALSTRAKAIGAAWFGMTSPERGGELVFRMKQSRPTALAQAGLDELVNAGIIGRSDYGDGGVRYVPLKDCEPLLRWYWGNRTNPDLGFKLTEPMEPTALRA